MNIIRAKYMISQIGPKLLSQLIENIRVGKDYNKTEFIAQLTASGKLQVRDPILLSELIGILLSFGIVKSGNEKSFTLTTEGNDLKKIYLRKRSVFFELYHLLMYYAFDMSANNLSFLPFKSYQKMCELLYFGNQRSNKMLADEISTYVSNEYKVSGSFSDACITRGFLWLYELTPTIRDGDGKSIVNRCCADNQAFLFNLDRYYTCNRVAYKDPLFIDTATRRRLCMPLFLSEDHFLDALDKTCAKYNNHVEKKYNISGTYIILKKTVCYKDL